jgi:outer membrane PBP1 activator LpoA protein
MRHLKIFWSLGFIISSLLLAGCNTIPYSTPRQGGQPLRQNPTFIGEPLDTAASRFKGPFYNPQFGKSTHIALLLPFKGPHFDSAKTIREGFLAAYYKNAQNKSTQPIIKIYDTGNGNGAGVHAAYTQAMREQASLIVGPLTKQEVQAISATDSPIPVLALNTITDSGKLPKNIYQFGLIPEDEVVSITTQAKRHAHHKAMIIAIDNEWGRRIVSAFKESWHLKGGYVVNTLFIKPNQDINQKMEKLLRLQAEQRHAADMIFLAMSNELARDIKANLTDFQIATLPIYATAAIYPQGIPAPDRDQALNGIRFCDMPWLLTATQHGTHSHSRFYALGIDAYQLAVRLAQENELPSTGVSGTTGDLYWNARQQRIQRGLVCYRFQSGIPVQD